MPESEVDQEERERGVHSISMMVPASDANLIKSDRFVLNQQANEKKTVAVTARQNIKKNSAFTLPQITARSINSIEAPINKEDYEDEQEDVPKQHRTQPGSEERVKHLNKEIANKRRLRIYNLKGKRANEEDKKVYLQQNEIQGTKNDKKRRLARNQISF